MSEMGVWQRLTMHWQSLVFGDRKVTAKVRALRLLEEVIELSQAEGVTAEEVATVTKQVMDKEPGEARQELGGVMICVAIYAESRQFDAMEELEREFKRIMRPEIMERVRRRNLNGDKIGMDAEDG